VKKHIDQLLEKDAEIDAILLACTHYPLLMDKIMQFVPESVSVISQGHIVAESLRNYLQRHPEMAERCSKKGKRSFYTTGEVSDFNNHASVFFGSAVEAERLVL
jgi:glutamate racemase